MPTAPNIRFLNALISRAHAACYRLTGGIVGGSLGGVPILLLTTLGRRSGQRRTVPLVYVREGDAFVLIGSNAGDRHQAAWYHNLRHHPEAAVLVRRERIVVRARAVTPEEYARLWPAVTRRYPAYAAYQRRTSRRIPLVVLEPAPPGPPGSP